MKSRIFCCILLLLILISTTVSCTINKNKNSASNDTENHTHQFGEWQTTTRATRTTDGIQIKYCGCGAIFEQTIPCTGHNYLENICINCGIHYHETDVYRYSKLKPYADKIALYIAKSQIKKDESNAYNIEYILSNILENDIYFNYIINITYNLILSDKTVQKKDRTYIINVDHNFNKNGAFLEIKGNVSAYKEAMNWNEKPSNFSYDFYEKLTSPQKVTLNDLINNPEKYVNEYVEVFDNSSENASFYIINNNTERASITIGTSLNATKSIELVSDLEIIDLKYLNNSNSRVNRAYGYVKFYINNNQPYIDLFDLELK